MNGRRGSPLGDRTAARLRRLLERQAAAEEKARKAGDELAVAVFAACEREGASRRAVASSLGVGTSTVQGWIARARQLAG